MGTSGSLRLAWDLGRFTSPSLSFCMARLHSFYKNLASIFVPGPGLFRGPLAVRGSQQGADEPAFPSGSYTPSLVPICPTSLRPWGTCPLHIFSAITPWSLEPYPLLQPSLLPRRPSLAQLIWTQTPVPDLGLWQVMAEGVHSAGASALGRGSWESRGPLLLCPHPIGQAAAGAPAPSARLSLARTASAASVLRVRDPAGLRAALLGGGTARGRSW